jgi:hypothetical protein
VSKPIITISNISSTVALATIVIDPFTIGLQPSESIVHVGVCYSESNQSPTVISGKKVEMSYFSSSTSYDLGMSDLSPETKYFARGYIETSLGNYIYGDVTNFTTTQIIKPTTSISNITSTTASANIVIDPYGLGLQAFENIVLVGACYSESNQNPTITSGKAVYKSYNASSTNYDVELSDLSPETKYYVRGYVKTSTGNHIYGDVTNFTTEKAEPNTGLSGTKWSCYAYGFDPADDCYLQGLSGYLLFTSDTHVECYNRDGINYNLELSGTYTLTGTNLNLNFGDVIFTGTISNNSMQGSGKHYVGDNEIHHFKWNGTKQTGKSNVVLNKQPIKRTNRK